MSRGIQPRDFNSYGTRRGNDRVMTRGTFANVRIKNLMVPGTEGGVTKYYQTGDGEADVDLRRGDEIRGNEDAVDHSRRTGIRHRQLARLGGERNALLGVKAVVAASFERIHRSNLVGMGVLPLQFPEGTTAQSLGLDGSEKFSITGLSDSIKPATGDAGDRTHERTETIRCR